MLRLDAGRLVPVDRLIGLLWGDDDPPRSARATIHTYVARLRQTLTGYGVAVATRHDGYLLEADGHTVDVVRFVDLAKRANAAVDPSERVRLFERALDTWRGPLLADLVDERLRHRLGAPRLELRLTSVETWAEARLAMGDRTRRRARPSAPGPAPADPPQRSEPGPPAGVRRAGARPMAAMEGRRPSGAGVLQHVRRLGWLGRWRLALTAGLRLPLYAAAKTGADLLADPRRYTVRRCSGVHFGWLYLDQSRLRQWCSMDICGSGAILRPDAVEAACTVTWTGAA